MCDAGCQKPAQTDMVISAGTTPVGWSSIKVLTGYRSTGRADSCVVVANLKYIYLQLRTVTTINHASIGDGVSVCCFIEGNIIGTNTHTQFVKGNIFIYLWIYDYEKGVYGMALKTPFRRPPAAARQSPNYPAKPPRLTSTSSAVHCMMTTKTIKN